MCNHKVLKSFRHSAEPSFLIFPNGLIMFCHRRREVVRPVILGDEIKIGDRGRMKGGEEGVLSGAANRRWRESVVEIGVVGRWSLKIDSGQISVEILNPVDHCRIALQRNSLP